MAGKGNGTAYSTLAVARMVGVHRATLLRWLQSGQLPEPRHVRAVGQDIRVWTARDVERARRLKEAHGHAALEVKTSRLLKADEHRRRRKRAAR
jgi:DNA-binding transcriptional MerR regulator